MGWVTQHRDNRSLRDISPDDAVLIYGDTLRNLDLRHRVPIETIDPFLFLATQGSETVVISALERPAIEALDRYTVIVAEAMGRDALVQTLGSRHRADIALMRQAVIDTGITRAKVSGSFPLELARELEAEGVHLEIDNDLFSAARRQKTAVELAGVRRATAAAEKAIETVRETLQSAHTKTGSPLLLDGEPLTVERLKRLVYNVVGHFDMSLDSFILSHGPQTAIGHEPGTGRYTRESQSSSICGTRPGIGLPYRHHPHTGRR